MHSDCVLIQWLTSEKRHRELVNKSVSKGNIQLCVENTLPQPPTYIYVCACLSIMTINDVFHSVKTMGNPKLA